ncbi:tRNA (adenosine(37)-N6)-dimethylallyltransferase MiaA [Rhodocyclus purpureus]|uniref:tRNA (adenosine(37)-N6)-dimethylallyltransferase MiaA n=1 Tax=Rhodocyclus purpureus TaxID=1067 RepID=UPI0019144A17|nr:tRNA (adenosine(37)-N6)-dimethylallyltransferase MiaA [Rhodocyclus purpureus]MBK5912949.1 tRNA (adenosine(37)-N6)-dimethylallyltransferase MiaA [Rhodocyclus purpureus]
MSPARTGRSALPPAILLMGPTASGKTDLAIALSERFPLEIVSVDSALVFRDMNLGTAKPDAATLKAFPHHLVDIIGPEEAYSAAQFVADASRLIGEINARGRVPLLVGGTMLYFRALQAGLADLPAADPATRAAIDAEAQERGWPALHAELAKLDPATAARLAPNDQQRIQRALEICRVSGQPMSALLAQQAAPPVADALALGLLPSARSVLAERIGTRFKAMLAAGLEDEVADLRARYRLHPGLPSMRCVGYRQVWEAQDGLYPRGELLDRGSAATRQLAKRQLTWMNNTLRPETFDCLAGDLEISVAARVDQFLAGAARRG